MASQKVALRAGLQAIAAQFTSDHGNSPAEAVFPNWRNEYRASINSMSAVELRAAATDLEQKSAAAGYLYCAAALRAAADIHDFYGEEGRGGSFPAPAPSHFASVQSGQESELLVRRLMAEAPAAVNRIFGDFGAELRGASQRSLADLRPALARLEAAHADAHARTFTEDSAHSAAAEAQALGFAVRAMGAIAQAKSAVVIADAVAAAVADAAAAASTRALSRAAASSAQQAAAQASANESLRAVTSTRGMQSLLLTPQTKPQSAYQAAAAAAQMHAKLQAQIATAAEAAKRPAAAVGGSTDDTGGKGSGASGGAGGGFRFGSLSTPQMLSPFNPCCPEPMAEITEQLPTNSLPSAIPSSMMMAASGLGQSPGQSPEEAKLSGVPFDSMILSDEIEYYRYTPAIPLYTGAADLSETAVATELSETPSTGSVWDGVLA